MQTFNFPSENNKIILALGAESAGNFSIYKNGLIFHSADFGDLLEENNFNAFKKAVLDFLNKNNVKPDVILSDLHPLMQTTLWGEALSKKFKAQCLQIQHHHAHIFSAIGDKLIKNETNPRTVDREPKTIYGITMDGTGYGTNERIWGGEVFQLKMKKEKLKVIERIGSLENQIMIGGELAIREPARMLIGILDKFLDKKEIYPFIKKYYSKNEFEILHNQLKQNFNCLETSSAGRILDAVSLLLGFCSNQRKYKHEAIDLLEANSTKPYANIRPKIIKIKNKDSLIENSSFKIDSKLKIKNSKFILDTTYLFEYLINNLHKDKKRLAATTQLYLAQGLYEIIKKNYELQDKNHKPLTVFASGGVTNNKIISKYFISKNIYLNNKIPRGDAGLSFGQIAWFLLKK